MIRLIKLVMFIGIPLLLFFYFFRLEKVTVTGMTRYTEAQIQEKVITTKWDENTLLLYLKHSYMDDIKIPFIEKLDWSMKDNHTIDIRVYEKMVIGCVEFMGEFLYFDKDGIIVESSSSQLDGIPLIKGLKFKRIILNEKLTVQKDELFDVILNLTQLIAKFELSISKIVFNSSYEVTVESNRIRAALGRRSTYDEVLYELKNIIQSVDANSVELMDYSEYDQLELDMTKYSKDTDKIYAKPKKKTE